MDSQGLDMDVHREPIKIERANGRFGPLEDSAGERMPRAVLMRLGDYKDRQRILQAAKSNSRVIFEGQEVSFYLDFSADIGKQRKE